MNAGLASLVSSITGLTGLDNLEPVAAAAAAAAASSISSVSPVPAISSISSASSLQTATPTVLSVTTATATATATAPSSLDVNDTTSILGVAKALAQGAMSYYPGTSESYAALPTPYYWWECGALMGAMLDYSHYTNDTTYDALLTTALAAQVVAPANDLMVPADYGSEGNDDQAFWTFSVLSAAERNFPQAADPAVPPWLAVAENAWNAIAARWNTSACGGGLLWQIFADNSNGLNYRNSVSNGGLFQISARLYRATGNATYLAWAEKVWDWSRAVEFVDAAYYVYDGADSRDNCSVAKRDNVTFSYSAGIYLYGAAVLANATATATATDNSFDASATWTARTQGLLAAAAASFFSPYDNATNIMYEHACEPYEVCDTDMKSFKGYLSRFLAASAVMVPAIEDTVAEYLGASAVAAGKACVDGADAGNGTTVECGEKWYTGAYDGNTGLGQDMSALETVQGLLAGRARAPLRAGEIQDVRMANSSSSS
ncbi:glycosyl hydrolase family 76-domain-containing protein, partial [Coniella lustricola]